MPRFWGLIGGLAKDISDQLAATTTLWGVGTVRSGSSQVSPAFLDDISGLLHGLVFPEMKVHPAERNQLFVNIHVPPTVVRQLLGPPLRVVLGSHVVDRTSVPEASVNEYGESYPSERDVRRAGQASQVYPEAKAPVVQLASKCDLGFRSRARHSRQPRLHLCTQGLWSGASHVVNLTIRVGR